MVNPSFLLICLLATSTATVAASGDSCLDHGLCLKHVLDDVSDEGSQFIQKASVAALGAKALEAGSMRPRKPTFGGVSKVTPVDCMVNNKPMQMIKSSNGFTLYELHIHTGKYTPLYDYPWNIVEGDYADLNACDINPFDEIIYCVMRAAGKSYAVRMDNATVEFVAKLPSAVWSAAAFSYTGEYFVSMHGSELIVVPPIHELPGYTDRTYFKLKDYSYLTAAKPVGFWYIADMVVVRMNITGSTSEENMISLYGPKLQVASIIDGKVDKTWVKEVRPARWDNIFGAGFNFDNKIMFSVNRGAGVYAIPLEDIDLDDESQVVNLNIVGLSDATDFNDGLNCKDLPNPWAYDATTTPAPTEPPANATEAPTEAPAEEPVPTEAPVTEAPVAAAPETPEPTPEPVMEPTVAPTLAPTPAPELAAPPTPPPMQPGAWRLLGLLLIPLVLAACCRHLHPPPSGIPPPAAPSPPLKPDWPPPRSSPMSLFAPSLFPPKRSYPGPPAGAPPYPGPPAGGPPYPGPPAGGPPAGAPAPAAPSPAPAPPPRSTRAAPYPGIGPGVTEIDKINASGQVVERDFIFRGAPQGASGPAVTEIDRVNASGQVFERDFIVGAAPQAVFTPSVTEIDRMNARGQVVERDFIISGAAQVVSAPAVTEIDKVNARGQVVERDFIVGGAQQVVSTVTEIDKVNARGQVVERDFIIGGGAPTITRPV